ncbi:MAG: PxKF domain-containing protein, partial [Caldilineaceae bacterium]|nr:PxKF domain-containing protein [Caldilineaceae bacterium]
AAGQADPATSQPVHFRADFTEAVTGFTASDVTLSGTINRTNATVTISGGPANYTVSVNGLIGNGTLLATIAANVATDNGGNGNNASTSSDNTVTVNLDTAPPTANPTQSPAPAPSGWNNTNVTVTWNWSDNAGGTGIDPANCTTSSVSSGEGTLTLNAICKDVAGNQGNASYTVQIDKTAPVVTVTGVSDGATYALGSVPTAACSSSDALSGVTTEATLSLTGGNPDGTGSFTATCSGAIDNAGNSGSTSVTYSVLYNWSGFFQPVDNLPTVNTVNAGQAIPVKFSLGGDYGLNIFASGYPASQVVSCGGGGGGSTSPIEETITAGASSLQYDPSTQHYIYVWKTDKAWAGSCRQLIVRLIDGTEHIALFQFNGKVRSAAASDTADATAIAERIFLPLVNR